MHPPRLLARPQRPEERDAPLEAGKQGWHVRSRKSGLQDRGLATGEDGGHDEDVYSGIA